MSRSIVPVLLLMALLLGGSVQGPRAMLVIELAAAVVLGWAAFAPSNDIGGRESRRLAGWWWVAAGLVVVQLVPLPPALWTLLPGRDWVEAGDQLVGLSGNWRPLTLDTEATVGALAFITLPLALVVAATRRGASRLQCAIVVVSAALLGACWGLAQRIGAASHPYPFSSTGPTGQFANTNHLAALCVTALPFIASLVARAERKGSQASVRMLGLLAGLLLVIVTVLTGALAMIALLLPVTVASMLIAVRRTVSTTMLGGAMILCVVAGAGLGVIAGDGAISATRRGAIWAQSLTLQPYAWTGAGFGTFQRLYQTVIDPMTAGNFIVNHAHNDLIEVIIEGGIPALILLVVLVAWWGWQSLLAWRTDGSHDAFAQAASVAVGVLLIHSLVDFPLRTLALAGLFAVCLALLAAGKPMKAIVETNELRPTRHRRVR